MDVTELIVSLAIGGIALVVVAPAVMPLLTNLSTQLSQLPGVVAAQPPAGTTTTTDANGNPVTVPAGGGTTTVTDANGNVYTIPTPPTGTVTTGANPQVCKSKYFGKCDTECKSGPTQNCISCKVACGLIASAPAGANMATIYSYLGMPEPIANFVTLA